MNFKQKVLAISILALITLAFPRCNNHKESSNIKVGSILSITGKMSNYGKSSQFALMAMSEVLNKEREKKGYPKLEIIFEDDKLETKDGVAAANKLIDVDKVSAIIGAQPSSITLAIAPIIESKKVVLVSPASTSTDVTTAGDYVFRTILSGEYEGKVSADLYKQYYNGKKLAILYINNDYGLSLKKVFLGSLGNPSVLELAYNETETRFSSYLTKIKENGIEVVYILGYNEMVDIFKKAKELNLNVSWLGAAQMGSQSLIDKIGNAADGTIFPYWEFSLESVKMNNSEFYSLFEKYSSGAELDAFAANAVDALSILNSVIKDKPMSGQEIKNELYKVKDFNGITGQLSFDKNGDVMKKITVKTIKNGKIVNL